MQPAEKLNLTRTMDVYEAVTSRRGAAEGQGGSHPNAGARLMMLGTVPPRARRVTVGWTKPV